MKFIKLLRHVMIGVFLIDGVSVVNAQESELVLSRDYAYSDEVYSGYGTISGAGKVYMVIDFGGDFPSGKYYYIKTNKNRKNKAWIYLTGSWDEYGTITLWEHGNSSKNGQFVGDYYRGTFKGTFYRNDGRRFTFNISLRD